MRSLIGLHWSLAIIVFNTLVNAEPNIWDTCRDTSISPAPECNQPLDAVTTLVTSELYLAKVKCIGCPVTQSRVEDSGQSYAVETRENDLLYNISLSHDRESVLVNGVPIFPFVSTPSSEPLHIYAHQVLPDTTVGQFRESFAHDSPACQSPTEGVPVSSYWCLQHSLWTVFLNYDLGTTLVSGTQDTREWEITFDAIGGNNGVERFGIWTFNNTNQPMVKITVTGRKVEERNHASRPQGGDTLFAPTGGREEVFKLSIFDVQIVDRSHKFDEQPHTSLWGRIKHFFGTDPAPPTGHVIYDQEEWGGYGKYGTLKNALGEFVHAPWWPLVFIIGGSTIGGLLGMYWLYRLFFWVQEQRQLMGWQGMDEVWQRMRADGHEDAGLLDEQYRDLDGYHDDDEPPPPRYSAELPVNKPLPSKPLPDKPLPAVPLIDMI